MFIAPDTGPDIPVSVVTNPTFGLFTLIGLVSVVLLLFGLMSLYIRHAQRAGVLGLLGFLLTFLGFLFSGVLFSFFATSVLPYLAAHETHSFDDAFSMIALYGLGGGVLLLIGTILLGISVIRAKVFPRVAGILLLVGGILTPASILGNGLIITLIGSVSGILINGALIWIGYILFVRPQADKIAQSSLSVASQA